MSAAEGDPPVALSEGVEDDDEVGVGDGDRVGEKLGVAVRLGDDVSSDVCFVAVSDLEGVMKYSEDVGVGTSGESDRVAVPLSVMLLLKRLLVN